MRQMVTIAPEQLELREAPAVQPEADEALVEVASVGICGSDIHLYSGSHPYSRFPNVQGHEFGGRVLSLPDDYAGPIRVGQTVAVEPLLMCGTCLPCRRGRGNCCVNMRTYGVHVDGALTDRIAVKAQLLHAADGLPAELVVLVETMSIALQATGRARISDGDTVVVFGAGPVGMGLLIASTVAGARVMMVDTLASRLELARALGAERTAQAGTEDVAAAIADWSEGDGPTVVAEATGVPRVFEQALEAVAPSGTVVAVGLSADVVSFPLVELTRKELTIVGSRNSMDKFGLAVELVRAERERIGRLVSHRFPLEEAAAAFGLAHHSPGEVEKVVIDVHREGAAATSGANDVRA